MSESFIKDVSVPNFNDIQLPTNFTETIGCPLKGTDAKGTESNKKSGLTFLPKSKLNLLGSEADVSPRRTWSLCALSSAGSPQASDPGGLRFPFFPDQRGYPPRRSASFNDDGKRRQAKLLLVSLLENFCMLYDESPHRNRKLFLVICKMLSSMGIVDEEYIDELSGVRHSYIKAFKDLVLQASLAVEHEKMLRQERRAISLQSSPTGARTPEEMVPELDHQPLSSQSITPLSFNTFIRSKNLDDLLNLYESRFRTDFEEKKLLGRGGFGSVWMAQNKLNGIMYAIKKIRLKDSFKSYDRMLREIKNLARLEHTNIVRYYSSWIEYVDYGTPSSRSNSSRSQPSNQGSKNPGRSTGSEFKTRKPKFTEDSLSAGFPYVSKESLDDDSLPVGSMFYRPGDSNTSRSASETELDLDHDSLNCDLSAGNFDKIQFTISDLDDSSDSASHGSDSSGPEIEFVDHARNGLEPYLSDKALVQTSRNPSEIWSPADSHNPESTLNSSSPRQLTLFIQMQLCGATLKDFLDWRNAGVCAQPLNKNKNLMSTSVDSAAFTSGKVVFDEPMPLAIDPNANIRLFRSIVEGVKYIHHSGLIHRDLKPANIFLSLPNMAPSHPLPRSMPATPTPSPPKNISLTSSSLPNFGMNDPELNSHLPFHDFDELVPKIGDFGLATSYIDPEITDDSLPIKNSHSSRTALVGTITYASPEQLSNPPKVYNEKSDIYSLGIIFFELFFPFSTKMERAKTLKDLRRGVLPDDFVTKWPKEAAFVLWLMADDPELRPSAADILEFELINPPTHDHHQLSHQLAQKNALVEELQEENRLLQARIQALEDRLASVSP